MKSCKANLNRLLIKCVLPSGFNELTTSMSAFLEKCVSEGKVRGVSMKELSGG